MKNLRQELIKFYTWKCKNNRFSNGENTIEYIIDEYLNFINSNESNEFRTVGNNENTQEKCEHHITYKGVCVACGKGDDTDLLGE